MAITGGCLCGDIRYSIDGPVKQTVVCHCKNCQKQAGSAFSVNLIVAVDDLHVEGETAVYQDIGDSGNAVRRRFCGKCGSPILSEIEGRSEIAIVKSGTLDDTGWLDPQAHIWCRSAQPWVGIDPDLPHFERGFT